MKDHLWFCYNGRELVKYHDKLSEVVDKMEVIFEVVRRNG